MARPKGGFPFSENFEVKKKWTFDARQLVHRYIDLLTFTEDDYIPLGFPVAVYDTDPEKLGIYICINTEALSSPTSWKKISDGTGATGSNDANLNKGGHHHYLSVEGIDVTDANGNVVTLDVGRNRIPAPLRRRNMRVSVHNVDGENPIDYILAGGTAPVDSFELAPLYGRKETPNYFVEQFYLDGLSVSHNFIHDGHPEYTNGAYVIPIGKRPTGAPTFRDVIVIYKLTYWGANTSNVKNATASVANIPVWIPAGMMQSTNGGTRVSSIWRSPNPMDAIISFELAVDPSTGTSNKNHKVDLAFSTIDENGLVNVLGVGGGGAPTKITGNRNVFRTTYSGQSYNQTPLVFQASLLELTKTVTSYTESVDYISGVQLVEPPVGNYNDQYDALIAQGYTEVVETRIETVRTDNGSTIYYTIDMSKPIEDVEEVVTVEYWIQFGATGKIYPTTGPYEGDKTWGADFSAPGSLLSTLYSPVADETIDGVLYQTEKSVIIYDAENVVQNVEIAGWYYVAPYSYDKFYVLHTNGLHYEATFNVNSGEWEYDPTGIGRTADQLDETELRGEDYPGTDEAVVTPEGSLATAYFTNPPVSAGFYRLGFPEDFANNNNPDIYYFRAGVRQSYIQLYQKEGDLYYPVQKVSGQEYDYVRTGAAPATAAQINHDEVMVTFGQDYFSYELALKSPSAKFQSTDIVSSGYLGTSTDNEGIWIVADDTVPFDPEADYSEKEGVKVYKDVDGIRQVFQSLVPIIKVGGLNPSPLSGSNVRINTDKWIQIGGGGGGSQPAAAGGVPDFDATVSYQYDVEPKVVKHRINDVLHPFTLKNTAGTNVAGVRAAPSFAVNSQWALFNEQKPTAETILAAIGENGTIKPEYFAGNFYLPIEKTHAQILADANSNNLTYPRWYKVTDHATKWKLNNCTVGIDPDTIQEGAQEPLLILSISANKFAEVAYSELYPNDEIRYNFFDILCEDGSTPRKGRITKRLDRDRNNGAEYDVRNIKYRRWRFDAPVWDSATTYPKWANVKVPVLDGNGVQEVQYGRLRWNYYVAFKENTNVPVTDGSEATGAWVKVLHQTDMLAYRKTPTYISESLFTVDTSVYCDYYTFSERQHEVANLGEQAVNAFNNAALTSFRNNIIGKSAATSGDERFYNNIVVTNCFYGNVYNNNFGSLYNTYFNWYTYDNNFKGTRMYGNIFLDQTFDNIVDKAFIHNYFQARFRWVTCIDEIYTFLCTGNLGDSIFTNDTTSNILMAGFTSDLRCFGRFGGNIVHGESNFIDATFNANVHNCNFIHTGQIVSNIIIVGKRIASLVRATFVARSTIDANPVFYTRVVNGEIVEGTI